MKLIEGVEEEKDLETFEARVRNLAASLILTIPVKVARKLDLKLGDKVMINIQRISEAHADADSRTTRQEPP